MVKGSDMIYKLYIVPTVNSGLVAAPLIKAAPQLLT